MSPSPALPTVGSFVNAESSNFLNVKGWIMKRRRSRSIILPRTPEGKDA